MLIQILTNLSPGSARQAEANAINYQFSSWNDTNQVEAIVEGQLGSFNGELPKLAIAEYKTGEVDNNWAEYSAMVTDLRTICPLETLVATMKTEYKFPIVSLYTATETRQGDAGVERPEELPEEGNDTGWQLPIVKGLESKCRTKRKETITQRVRKFQERYKYRRILGLGRIMLKIS